MQRCVACCASFSVATGGGASLCSACEGVDLALAAFAQNDGDDDQGGACGEGDECAMLMQKWTSSAASERGRSSINEEAMQAVAKGAHERWSEVKASLQQLYAWLAKLEGVLPVGDLALSGDEKAGEFLVRAVCQMYVTDLPKCVLDKLITSTRVSAHGARRATPFPIRFAEEVLKALQ